MKDDRDLRITRLEAQVERLEREVRSKENEILNLSSPGRYCLHNDDDTYHPPEHGWVCFHCGDTLFTYWEAEAHFGTNPTGGVPKCKQLLEELNILKSKL